MLKNLLMQKNLPEVLNGLDPANPCAWRRRMLDTLSEYEYGHTPAFDGRVYSFVETKDTVYGGKATRERIRLSFLTPRGMFSFPVQLLLPRNASDVPVFLHIAFSQNEPRAIRDNIIVEHIPEEEILDHGYGMAILVYEEVTSDSGRRDGLALAYPDSDWGTIGMWAFAASRTLDYLVTRGEIDQNRVSVSGWSRLGKTALWCAAQDERFSLAISTESGCSGAALQRGKAGESVRDIVTRFPFWFCRRYADYMDREAELPMDQHWLLALIAPRALFIGSAELDTWADPQAEFLAGAAVSPVYEAMGERGLVTPDELPQPDTLLIEGKVGYLLRRGEHALLRQDWLSQIQFRNLHHV